jgi:hypothetical protein
MEEWHPTCIAGIVLINAPGRVVTVRSRDGQPESDFIG